MTYVIIDTSTGRQCGKAYGSRRKARDQAHRLSKSAGSLWRFRCVEAGVQSTKWGEVQLPPAGATVNLCPADELLIAAAVRRLG
jgi:hypothetical protein